MLIEIDNVLEADDVKRFRRKLDQAPWHSGTETAGGLARRVKRNEQLSEQSDLSRELARHVLARLSQHPRFVSAALPARIYPPRFNRYRDEGSYGAHVDASMMQIAGQDSLMRTDLSATLFLSDPDEYAGGELQIETIFGQQQVRLPAGQLVLYPASSLHQVLPVTRGCRTASFFWIQSLVRDAQQREHLFRLDQSVQALTVELGESHGEVTSLSGLYHNLLRYWAET